MCTMKLFCSTLLLMALAAGKGSCGEVDGGRIYHGRPARSGQFPFVTQLILGIEGSNGVGLCTGSLIAEQWVLSAGHCAHGISYADISIGKSRDPANNRSETVLIYRVPKEDVTIHPNYNNDRPGDGYDLALFKLPQPVDVTTYPNIKIIKITEEVPVDTYDSYKAISVGWGITRNNQNSFTKRLQYANVTTQVHDQCKQQYGALDSHICTLRKPPKYSGTCGGDSGGPLVVSGSDGEPLQVGANSLGLGNCERKLGTLYTYVGSYTSWIRQTIA